MIVCLNKETSEGSGKSMKRLLTIIAVLASVTLTMSFAFDLRDEASVRIAKTLYVRERVSDLREFGVAHLRERLNVRPLQECERRIALVPCVYRDSSGKLLTWGLDLPQPDGTWITFEKTSTSTVPLNMHLSRFAESIEHQCWCVVAWHGEWKLIPSHGSLNCLTNVVAVVAVPK